MSLWHTKTTRTTLRKMATNQDIFNLIKEIKADQDAMRREADARSKNIEKELNGMNTKLEEVKEDAIEVKNKVEGIEKRLTAIEKDNEKKRRDEVMKRKRETDNRKQGEKEKVTEGTNSYAAALGGQPGGSKDTKESPVVEEVCFKSTWARQLSQANLEQQLKMATIAAKKMEDEKGGGFKASKTPVKQNKLGNSLDRHSEDDWAWTENDSEWEGTTNRQARNREKKVKEEKKKREKIEKAAYIGRCTLGIGPIRQESIDFFNKITADYGLAKKMAAAEFLQGYLKFDESDLSDIDITDTKMSAKGDSVLYIVLDCPEKVINIRRRIADCRNDDIKIREFIPPHFFARYTALARYAAEMRAEKPEIKTQIRFLERDIGLFTKTKGSMLPFLPVNMEDIDLPVIDHNADWKRKTDLPPWRRTSPAKKQVLLKSLAGLNKDSNRLEDKTQPKQKKLKGSNSIRAESSTEGSSTSSSEEETPACRKENNADNMETSS